MEVQSFDLCLLGRFLTYGEIDIKGMRNKVASLWWPSRGICIRDISILVLICSNHYKIS